MLWGSVVSVGVVGEEGGFWSVEISFSVVLWNRDHMHQLPYPSSYTAVKWLSQPYHIHALTSSLSPSLISLACT